MALPRNHMVYGYVTNAAGVGIDGVLIEVFDYNTYQGTAETTTSYGGYYQVNLKNYADKNNTVVIRATYSGESIAELIVADTNKVSHEVTIVMGAPPSTSYGISYELEGIKVNISKYFPKPYWGGGKNNISFKNKLFNFWDNQLEQVIYGLNEDTVVIHGYGTVEEINGLAVTLNDIMNNGNYIIISYLGDKLNGKYVIKSLRLQTIPKNATHLDYILTLEPVLER